MLIGQDYNKIEVELFGWFIQEPNAFITDFIMALISLILGFILLRNYLNTEFETWWISFFVLFGISSLCAAFGHLFFHYWGIAGKFPNWITGIPIIYFIERAMITLIPENSKKNRYRLLALYKMILVYTIFGWICLTFPIKEKPQIAFLPIALNTIFGVIISAGILSYQFSKKEQAFKTIFLGVIIMLPSAFVFLLKINIHPWFDKNDLSHTLLTIGIVFFYFGVEKVKNKSFNFIINKTTI
jgi:hypothetical protein